MPLNRRQSLLIAPSALAWAAGLRTGSAQGQSAPGLAQIEAAARAEGWLHSGGMPNTWANWESSWNELKRLYGIQHRDWDLNSAESLDRMEAEGSKGTLDLADVGFEYGAMARGRGISRPHKPSHWEQIPDWAKDSEGYWALAYTGTVAFLVNTRRSAERGVPRSWAELFERGHRVLIGQVGSSALASAGVLSAAIALGGDERHLQAALERFAKLAAQGGLLTHSPSLARMESGVADVFITWDFLALAMRERLSRPRDYEVLIPSDGSVTSGYTTLINKHAPHPNAAVLTREYIFSDAGQINLARGFARPIRINQLKLPDSVSQALLDPAQYSKARVVKHFIWAWEAKKLSQAWAREVLSHMASPKP
ncbi:extracellular solute-binding protein [Paucibacter sp. AS339]|uniref:ABC transporter substrate-binding protein n=1 Tax=Paucibacter hankyongi TaxID=3133434 RepID=UPI0030B05351